MILYRVNSKFVDKDIFYEELKRMYDKTPQVLTFDEYLERIDSQGYVFLQAKKRKSYMYDYFYAADEEVFELEQIIAENEYDPLDGDSFSIAYAIYQHGYRKQKENTTK